MTASDHILIFFTQNARKIDMAMIANHGTAELKMIEIPAGKQSADMHIGSYLGYLAGISNCKIVIVSKDTDFDPVIQFWKKRFGISVSRKKSIRRIPVKKQSNLQIITPASEAQIRTLFDQNFNQSPYLEKKEAIIALFLNATDKQSLNTELTKLIPGSSIPELYKVFKEFKKICYLKNKRQMHGGGLPNEAYCIEKIGERWIIYHSERGRCTSLKEFEIEQEACPFF